MIRVTQADEPASFDEKVRIPGLRAIAEMVGETPARRAGQRHTKLVDRREDIPSEKFPTYWTKALDELMEAYASICAYSCFRIHPVTGAASVDHFAAKSRAWNRIYEWDNYRLACSRANARKKDLSGLLGPFEVQDDWFYLELVGFQVVPNPNLDESIQRAIQNTIDILGLNDFSKDRATDAEYYWNRDVSLRILTRESPFVAKELRRQGRLNPGDT